MGEYSAAGWASSSEEVRRRYRHLALVYPLLEVLLALPWGIRAQAVDRLGVGEGSRVLEVGCGTGRNLPLLVKAVGRSGRVYGIDVTPEMLEVARRTCVKNGWSNVVLFQADAEHLALPEPVDAVLFSLSYTVMPNHLAVLMSVWRQLRPEGRLVVLDGGLPTGGFGRVLRPISNVLSRWTVLGNPEKRPWQDLRAIAGEVHKEDVWPGIYYVCWAARPSSAS